MASPDVKVSKKRRQDDDPEAAKRRQKKQKKASQSAESDPPATPGSDNDDPNGTEHLKNDIDPTATESSKPKKDKKKKKSKTEGLPPAEANGADADAHAVTPSVEDSLDKPKKSKKSKKDGTTSTLTDIHAEGAAQTLTPPPTAPEAKPKKSKKKRKDVEDQEAEAQPADRSTPVPSVSRHTESKSASPEAKRKKRKDKSRDTHATPPPSQPSSQERLATDSPSAERTSKPKTSKPSAPAPPVVMQQVARWVPLWPRGWSQPITAAIEQHFTPKLNRYDGDMGGVLLAYNNVCLNDRPTRKGAATQDSEAVKLLSVNEFGVGFCWLIADLELFLPKRGSWMEGELILQNQGHVGVVCWDKFNASIESSRLPPKWNWVPASEEDFANDDYYNMDVDGGEEGNVESTTPLGYWVDESGNKVEGKLRFRIKNYDVGLSGDHSFLCIEGTMLDEKDENRMREREIKTAGGMSGAGARKARRKLPEFSMTDLGLDDEAEKGKKWRQKKLKEEEAQEEVEGEEVTMEGEDDAGAQDDAVEVVEED